MEDIILIKGFLATTFSKLAFEGIFSMVKWNEELTSTVDGSKVKINRKMAYVSDTLSEYRFANLKFEGETWNEYLTSIKDKLNAKMNYDFNSVLLNLYKDGKDTIKWHSDKEEIIGPNPIIACVNLGATRKFWFRKQRKIPVEPMPEKFFYEVEDGDLLIMGENCQKNYLHAILEEKNITEQRISLTFRKVFV